MMKDSFFTMLSHFLAFDRIDQDFLIQCMAHGLDCVGEDMQVDVGALADVDR